MNSDHYTTTLIQTIHTGTKKSCFLEKMNLRDSKEQVT